MLFQGSHNHVIIKLLKDEIPDSDDNTCEYGTRDYEEAARAKGRNRYIYIRKIYRFEEERYGKAMVFLYHSPSPPTTASPIPNFFSLYLSFFLSFLLSSFSLSLSFSPPPLSPESHTLVADTYQQVRQCSLRRSRMQSNSLQGTCIYPHCWLFSSDCECLIKYVCTLNFNFNTNFSIAWSHRGQILKASVMCVPRWCILWSL